MQKWFEKYRLHITSGLILFIAIGGISLLYEEQRDKILSAQNALNVEKQGWQKEKSELGGQIDVLQQQITQIGKQSQQSNQQGTVAGASTTQASGSETSGLINLNTANESALDSLPGIGPSKAKAIIEYRNEKGMFKNITDLKNVKGIGDATFEKLKSKITV